MTLLISIPSSWCLGHTSSVACIAMNVRIDHTDYSTFAIRERARASLDILSRKGVYWSHCTFRTKPLVRYLRISQLGHQNNLPIKLLYLLQRFRTLPLCIHLTWNYELVECICRLLHILEPNTSVMPGNRWQSKLLLEILSTSHKGSCLPNLNM